MTGFTGLDLLDNALGVALLAGLAAALTLAFGIEGTATAAAVSIAAVNLVRLAQVRRRVGIQPYDRSYLGLLVRRGRGARGVRRPRRGCRQLLVVVARRHNGLRTRRLLRRASLRAPEQRASGDRHVPRANRRTTVAGRAAADAVR